MPQDKGVTVEVDTKDFQRAIDVLPNAIRRNLISAGQNAGWKVIETRGLKRYPPTTAANREPYPYYERGYGMRYKGPSKYEGGSERYGTQWNVKASAYKVVMGNRASYAPYLTDDKLQNKGLRAGWKKLINVTKQKKAEISRIYTAWVRKAITSAGFRLR